MPKSSYKPEMGAPPEKPRDFPSSEKVRLVYENIEPDDGRKMVEAAVRKALENNKDESRGDLTVFERPNGITWNHITEAREKGEPGVFLKMKTERKGLLWNSREVPSNEAVMIVDMRNGEEGQDNATFAAVHIKFKPKTKPPEIEGFGLTKILDQADVESALEGESKGGLEKLNARWLRGEIADAKYKKELPTCTLGRTFATAAERLANAKVPGIGLKLSTSFNNFEDYFEHGEEERRAYENRKKKEADTWHEAQRAKLEVLDELGLSRQKAQEGFKRESDLWSKWVDEQMPEKMGRMRERVKELGLTVADNPGAFEALIEAYGLQNFTTPEQEIGQLKGNQAVVRDLKKQVDLSAQVLGVIEEDNTALQERVEFLTSDKALLVAEVASLQAQMDTFDETVEKLVDLSVLEAASHGETMNNLADLQAKYDALLKLKGRIEAVLRLGLEPGQEDDDLVTSLTAT
ncbi:MAG: hypothetical protein AAB443_04810 [Patescibacteria group bacterium]